MSRFTVKAIFAISDLSEPQRGNTWVVPCAAAASSAPFPACATALKTLVRTGDPTVAACRQMVCRRWRVWTAPTASRPAPSRCYASPGSAMIFDRRLLHAQTPNLSPIDRAIFIIGWGYRWLRPVDGLYVEPALSAARCPIVRQLLGDTTSSSGLYHPSSADTPLRAWLQQHGEDEQQGLGFEHLRNRESLDPRWLALADGPQRPLLLDASCHNIAAVWVAFFSMMMTAISLLTGGCRPGHIPAASFARSG